MPRIILQSDHLESIQQQLKAKRGVDFTTSNEQAVLSMLKYWCRESAKGEADVESVAQQDTGGFLVEGNRDFLKALQSTI